MIIYCIASKCEIYDKIYSITNYYYFFKLHFRCLIDVEPEKIIFVTEIINFVTKIIKTFPQQLDIKKLDFIRIALSSWIVSVAQSIDYYEKPKVAIFIASVYRCFSAFSKYINEEKTKSSTKMIKNIVEEWEQIFAKDVNLVLLKSFLTIINHPNINKNCLNKFQYFLDNISEAIDLIDLSHVLKVI